MGLELVDLRGSERLHPRILSHMDEFDRVCGGGLVPGSVLLIGGDPGIGKSTLLLQVMATLSQDISVAYISGEEGTAQVRLRAERLGLAQAAVKLAAGTNVRSILATIDRPDGPKVVVIDSIQTMYVDSLDSAPGTVAQVRASSAELIRVAKERNIVMFLVGHVTKEGTIAGPRVMEHMVDGVLYFEGDRGHSFRILRAVKNRFGPCDEIGVFDMTDRGLTEVPNPSALFLADRRENVSGTAVFAGMEGTRPVLCEIQALVAPSYMPTPRRTVVGWDSGRLAMILAVLESRCGVPTSSKEVYLNVAGGLKISEPAADLAVAAAVLSAISHVPLASDAIFFGEIGLTGEIRGVNQQEHRLKEATKMGFATCFMPRGKRMSTGDGVTIQPKTLDTVIDLLGLFGMRPKERAKKVAHESI